MYAHISGTLAAVGPDSVVIDAGGVGYRLAVPLSALDRLPPVGQPAKLFTYTYVKEDALRLFGFLEDTQRQAFEVLIGVPQVGPRLALALLSLFTPEELCGAVEGEDVARLQQAPGVGAKLAGRLVLELKGRLRGLPQGTTRGRTATDASADAVSGLQGLGYSRQDADRAVDHAIKSGADPADPARLVKDALRWLISR